jgi:hypothetical protein
MLTLVRSVLPPALLAPLVLLPVWVLPLVALREGQSRARVLAMALPVALTPPLVPARVRSAGQPALLLQGLL